MRPRTCVQYLLHNIIDTRFCSLSWLHKHIHPNRRKYFSLSFSKRILLAALAHPMLSSEIRLFVNNFTLYFLEWSRRLLLPIMFNTGWQVIHYLSERSRINFRALPRPLCTLSWTYYNNGYTRQVNKLQENSWWSYVVFTILLKSLLVWSKTSYCCFCIDYQTI